MMQVDVSVSADVLDWIMAHTQLDRLPEPIAEHLKAWSSGAKRPTFNQIEKTSKATGIPLGYFFLKKPPKENLSLIEYRTVDSVELTNPSRNLIDTMHDMEMVQDWMHNYLLREGAEKVTFIGAQRNEKNVKSFATFVRELLSLPEDWYIHSKTVDDSFKTARNAISNVGVTVMMSGIVENNTHRALDINEFRAFAMIDDYAPLIFINSNDSVNARMFSLLHEFAHICIGENSFFNERYSASPRVSKAEQLCNAVAAEILVPQERFVREWKSTSRDLEEEAVIRVLADRFKCGTTVIARKALDSDYINYSQYEKTAQTAIEQFVMNRKRQKEESDGGDYYRTLASRIDGRFLRMLTNSVATGDTLYTDAFRLTNTNRTTFANLVEKVGGVV